jgi:3-hydroxyisobutyrate dehydrogenase-like beta-hydroxyacid dehydrogenase
VTRVGFLGLGRMGGAMARRVAAAGLLAAVWNRSPGPAEALAGELGVEACATPADVARVSDVVVTMVSDGAAVEAVAHGPDGLVAGLRPGAVWAEMSTIGRAPVAALAQLAAGRGAAFVDAPVSGSVAAASAGTLTIMVGGEEDALERARPALEAMGQTVLHLGGPGAGATMKLAVNSLVFAVVQAVAESLVLAEAAGIERSRAYDVFGASAARSPVVDYRRPQFEDLEGAPVSFSLELTAKDFGLILGLASELGARMPQAELNADVVQAAIAAGRREQDIAAVAAYLRGD